jgi:hypothetical protein
MDDAANIYLDYLLGQGTLPACQLASKLVGRFCLPETELVPQFLNIYSDKNIL